MSSIITNASAMTALRVLEQTNKNLADTQNRISTGLKVSSAKDNASFWAVSTSMKSDVNSFKAISDNLSLAENSLAVARVGAENITKLIDTIKTKTTQAQAGEISKEKLQADIDEALKQIAEITGAANFNGVKLLEEDTDVRLLSSIGRSGTDVTASYISFTSQNLGFGAGGGLEAINGLSVLNRGDSLATNKTDGVSVHDMGAIDTRRVRLTFDDVTFSTSAADNDFNLTYRDTSGAAQTLAIDNLASNSDMNDLAAAIMAQATGTQAVVDSVTWDEEKGLTINMTHGNTFTDFQEDGTGVAINNSTTYTGDKGNELTFTYTDAGGINRTVKHTLTQDITANAEGAADLVAELNANSKFSALFNIAYDSNSSTFKISNVSRDTDVTLTGWSGSTFTKQNEVVRFDVGRNATGEAVGANITLDTTSGDNDFQITYLDADGVQKTASFSDAASDWADATTSGFVSRFNTAMAGVATASYSATNGLTVVFKNGASFVDIDNVAAGNAANVTSSTPQARETTTTQKTDITFQDSPLRLGEEVSLNYDVNGVNKTVVFKVTGNETATGTRIDDESNPNRIVLALDAREVTHASTSGSKIASEIKAALESSNLPSTFGLAAGATGVQHTSIGWQVDGAKLTLNAAGGFDDIKTATLPQTDYQSLLDNLENALQTATDAAATLGSAQGRIDIQKEFLGALSDSLKVGIGTLVDANMNEESARLQALQVQQQLGIQSLSIANQAPQALLSLFR